MALSKRRGRLQPLDTRPPDAKLWYPDAEMFQPFNPARVDVRQTADKGYRIRAKRLGVRCQHIGIEAQSMEDGGNTLPRKKFHRRRKRRDDEIIATVVAVIR